MEETSKTAEGTAEAATAGLTIHERDTASVTGEPDEDRTYFTPSEYRKSTGKYRIRKARYINAPEAVLEKSNTRASVIHDIAKDTESFRFEKVAHIMLRNKADPKDRIKAIMLLLSNYEFLPIAMAMKTINAANKLMAMDSVDNSDKVKLATAVQKLVIKPYKQLGPKSFEELKLEYDGQYIIEVDD